MNTKAIIYTSNTGHTARYAKLLGSKTGLPFYTMKEAAKHLNKGDSVIYMGWLMASAVKDYKKAAKRYQIDAVCGVGLGPTGYQMEEVRKANAFPEELPLFTLQGGMDMNKLRGMNKIMIKMLLKVMLAKTEKTEEDKGMIYLLQKGGDYVSEENLAAVTEWFEKQRV